MQLDLNTDPLSAQERDVCEAVAAAEDELVELVRRLVGFDTTTAERMVRDADFSRFTNLHGGVQREHLVQKQSYILAYVGLETR